MNNRSVDRIVIDGDIALIQTIDGEIERVYHVGTVVRMNYNELIGKPKIEGNVLEGNKTFEELGLGEITPQDIDDIIYGG